ncbi:MAG: DNA repair protein RecN [bacterium]
MLRSLSIKNIALVDNLKLEFDPGMTVITGETGAGKSVLVNSLSLILGERADKEYIRHGCETAFIDAQFETDKDSDLLNISRQISKNGTSKISINDSPAKLTDIKEVLPIHMAQILGQHSGQMLMNEDNHLEYLDRFGGLTPLCEKVNDLFKNWQKISDDLRGIVRKRDYLIKERELLLFQKEEIEKASIRVGEEEELLSERKILDSAQNLMASASKIDEMIGGDNLNLTDMVTSVRKEIDSMSSIDASLEKLSETATEISFQLEELRREIEQYGSSVQDDPIRLEEVNLRLDEIYKLKKKYGGSEQTVCDSLIRIKEQLQNQPDTDELINTLSLQEDKARQAYSKTALELSKKRNVEAKKLNRLVISELIDLAIDGAKFECGLIYEEDDSGIIINGKAVKPFPYGLESAKFLFSANPGEPLKSLVKTASGGELSRVQLAILSSELNQNNKKNKKGLCPPTLVFDEVDAGIGGKTAIEVGNKLKKLSKSCQVIVITHLHQIARLADHHFVVEKKPTKADRTIINVTKLSPKQIPAELERMIALPSK